MFHMTSRGRELLRQPHTSAARVDIKHGGVVVRSLLPVDGKVTTEATRPVLRNVGATLIDGDYDLDGDELEALLSPYDCEVAPYRGVVLDPTDEIEWVPQGVFLLTDLEKNDDRSITITGQDRATLYQGPMTGALGISANTPIEKAILSLLRSRNQGVTMQSWATSFRVGPLLYQPDIDVWGEARELARAAGGTLYHDRTGQLVFEPLVPTNSAAVTRYQEGPGSLLVQASRKVDADTIHNVVVVTSRDGLIRVVAEDTDPRSPTYSGRRRSTVTLTSPHIHTIAQAKAVAATELMRELGRSEVVTYTAIPDPALDPLDVTVVHAPRFDIVERGVTTETIDLPLAATGLMTVGTRRSTLARNGQVLDERPPELTTA